MPFLEVLGRWWREWRRVPLREAVRNTRRRLDFAIERGDRAAIAAAVADLRAHADRADAEAAVGGFQTGASRLLRELADETEKGS